jgi:tetratricopeptide (TPR) repeat protein
MEDHCHAYGLWKKEGFSNAICVHVDAHLDVMDRGFTMELLHKVAQTRSVDDLQNCLSPNYLPWGGVHCGNYLYPALKEGLVTHLVWVVPKQMIGDVPLLDFTHEELLNWVEITFEEHDSLHLDGPRVEGTLAGQRFTLCTSENLPEFDHRPILLDIDVDYFQDQNDQVWQTPGELAREMSLPKVDALTIAYSVDGGYTCLEHRYLGEIIERVFVDGPDSPWESRLRDLLIMDSQRSEKPDYGGLLKADDPNWFKAAVTLKGALASGLSIAQAAQEAVQHDRRYKAVDMNEALAHFRSGRHDQALSMVGTSDDNNFVRAVIAFQCGRFELAKECWSNFLKSTELQPKERAFALFIRGQSSLQLNQLQESLQDLAEAASLDPSNYQYQLFHGLALQLNGDLKAAAKVWRKALSRHGDRLATIGLHLELSRLYRAMGRAALADAELNRVTQKDSAGQYTMVVQLEHLRAKKPGSTIPRTTLQGLWATPMLAGGVR